MMTGWSRHLRKTNAMAVLIALIVALFIAFAVFFLLSTTGFPDGISFLVAIFAGAWVSHLWNENRKRGG